MGEHLTRFDKKKWPKYCLKTSKNRKNTTLFGEYLQNYTSLYLLNLPRNRQMKMETSTKIISKHNMNHHFNADDSQIYLSFKPSAAGEPTTYKLRIKSCIHDVNNWMLANKLMLNHDKTELLVLHARHRPQSPLESFLFAQM